MGTIVNPKLNTTHLQCLLCQADLGRCAVRRPPSIQLRTKENLTGTPGNDKFYWKKSMDACGLKLPVGVLPVIPHLLLQKESGTKLRVY